MTKELIYVAKNKLIGIDNILPILMEIKSLYPDINISIVFFDKKHLATVKENYNIFEAIQELRPNLWVAHRKNKLATLIAALLFILRFAFRRKIIIKDEDILPMHNLTTALFRVFAKTREIKTYLITKSFDGHKSAYIENLLTYKNNKEVAWQRLFGGYYDSYLSVLSADEFKRVLNIDTPRDKIVKVGYLRRLAQWQEFVDRAVNRNRVVNGSPYFLYVLAYLGRRRINSGEPELIELMEESLAVLKRFNGRIRTVFKPHVVTDLKRVKGLISKVGYTNYVIDYGHPMVLSSKAQFIFGNIFSDTMYDAYYLGVPVVEYCHYDEELFSGIGRMSHGGACCDFFIWHDKEKLEEVVGGLIEGTIKVKRDPDFIKSNFQDTPQEFYRFWNRLVSESR